MSVAPLAILSILAGGVLATARLAKSIKRQREGYADHDGIIPVGQSLYNPINNLLNVLKDTTGIQDPAVLHQGIATAIGEVNTNLPAAGAPMVVTGGQATPLPDNSAARRAAAVAKCEKVNTSSCAAFDDSNFASNCGICFKPGTDSKAENHIGGLFLDPGDAVGAELQSRAMGERRVNYRPTVGTCPPGFFMKDKESCLKLEKRIECEQKKTFSIANCSQCYTDGSYTIVDAAVSRADISLLISYIGSLKVTLTGGSSTPIATGSSTTLGDNTVPLGQIPEGAAILITVEGTGAVIGGYVQGPTTTGVFKLEIAQLSDADLESGARPRLSGETSVGGASCMALRPGRGKTKMVLRVNIPLTFADIGEPEAASCASGPFLTKESSAKTLSAGTCFKPGNGPGKYSMECLQEKFVELGCTTDGTGYPRDNASFAALNVGADGSPQQIGNIANTIYENSLKATTGVSSSGVKQSLAQWNEASMFCTGEQILSACDTVKVTGSMSSDCMADLWQNKGAGNRIGATYSASQRNSSLAGSADNYCTANGLLSPFGPDGKPQQDAIQRANTAGGTINDIKNLYDMTHRRANNNSLTDNDRKAAINDCYGVTLNTPVPPTPTIQLDDLKALRTEYMAILTDLVYLSGLGLGPSSGNVTFNQRYARKAELDKQVLKPIKARYVRIRPSMNPGPDDRCIQISQLQVFNSSGQEVARGRPTSSSSVLGGGPAYPSKAVDGNATARPYPQMFHDACNTAGLNQFWMVDLGSEQDLSYIIYYNRINWDCCSHRANGMPVELLDARMNIVGITKINGQANSIRVDFTIFDKQGLPWNNLA